MYKLHTVTYGTRSASVQGIKCVLNLAEETKDVVRVASYITRLCRRLPNESHDVNRIYTNTLRTLKTDEFEITK